VKIISLGWGLQSWTMAAMVAMGELQPIDVALHADTTWERQATYEFAEQMTTWLEQRGVRVVTVVSNRHGQIKNEWEGTFIPAFTRKAGGEVAGVLRRQCTGSWKIQPMRWWIRQEMERRSLRVEPGVIEQWLGITIDEIQRAKDSDVKYIKHRFPLLEAGMSRADCLGWLEKNNLPIPVKSSCTFCPFHSRGAWEEMKRQGGEDWEQAVDVDHRIRSQRPSHTLYVHRARVPLDEAVPIAEDFGMTQLDMFASDDTDSECDSGYCFL